MKKSVKRILCSVLSLAMVSTLVVENILRPYADQNAGTVTNASVSFKDVTGTADTSALRAQNFNSQVLETEQLAPKYETRTVMVTLKGDCLAQAADGVSAAEYAKTFSGEKTLSDIRKEQNAFLKKLKATGISFKEERRYTTLLNAVAIEVNTEYVSRIKEIAGVDGVVITTSYAHPETVDGKLDIKNLTNLTSVYDTGIYNSDEYTSVTEKGDLGEGTVVAILDTGLDYTHEAYQRQPQNPVWNETIVQNKLDALTLRAEEHSNGLELADVYISSKVPFAYDYADKDADVYPSYSNHGTHVAGIIGGYAETGYTDKDGNAVTDEAFRGVVPDAQLVICKVFTDDLDDEDLGGAEAEDIIAALEDCVMLGVDVINMSLGTACGFSTTNDGDDEGEMLNAVYENIQKQGISLVCAASNDYSSGYGGVFGTNLKSNPDSSTVGSPSTFASALSVASISGQKSPYMTAAAGTENESYVFFEEARDENGSPYKFVEQMLGTETDAQGNYVVNEKEFEYVAIEGTGAQGDYNASLFKNANGNFNRIALVRRGDSTFQEKVQIAKMMGAVAIIVYNNVSGLIRMNLGEVEDPIPAISIDLASGLSLVKLAKDGEKGVVGKITISRNTEAGPFMSEFSSWGPTHDLKLKPEITAHGGEITSTVPGGYGEQSGTSMASPNMAGVMAIVRNYVKSLLRSEDTAVKTKITELLYTNGVLDNVKLNRLANQLMMSTATTVRDTGGRPYSPRKQGAGLGSLSNVVEKTTAFLSVDNAEADYRPKLEIGDDPEKSDTLDREKLAFKVTNFGSSTLYFKTDYLFFTETVSQDGLAVAEQAYMLDDAPATWYKNGTQIAKDAVIAVNAGETVEISATLRMSADEIEYLKNFPNGMYLEGFLKLVSVDENGTAYANQCDLSIPFLGFHGDWETSPMLDFTAYEVAEEAKDPAIKEEEKIQASVWATQPYSTYYNEKYILPMGGYVYLLDESDDPMYANEDYNAVSRYNDYYGEDNSENYMTSTGIKAVYAGLLRNARVVRYSLMNVETGEYLFTGKEIPRVGKAYSGGGSAVPANVELELFPEEIGLLGNGKYKMDFEFYMNEPEVYTVFGDDPLTADVIENANNCKDTYSFTFTVDYEAPVLQDARIRYYDYKDDGKEKQRIYLDLDVFDNHYAQAIMLCYPVYNAQNELVLQLATDYPTPVRNPNKNGTTTVSIEITDLYEKYGSQLYVQIDDYAVNSCLYQLDVGAMNKSVLPKGDFAVAEGSQNITLGVYDTHKVGLIYDGAANISNFSWATDDPEKVGVRNGEIVGLAPTSTPITVTVSNGETVKRIQVTVTDSVKTLSTPKLSFGIIKTATEALKKATGTVEVNAGESFTLTYTSDPWYHPMTGLSVVWSTDDPKIATVDQSGNVKTLKKGTTTVYATLYKDGRPLLDPALVRLRVVNEFDVSNYTLYKYHGVGYNQEIDIDGDGKTEKVLVMPTDMNIMYIGEDAFKDNDNIERIVIPASVMEIRESAFENCSALKEVYFVSTEHRVLDDKGTQTSGDDILNEKLIDWSDLSIVYQRAFYNCTSLEKVDLANVKTITIASECFAGCTSLKEVVDMPSIGTMHHRAFAGCTSLKEVDLTGLHMSGNNVFEGCTALNKIKTGKFTAIGKEAFKNCTGLRATVVISTPKLGEGAFAGCTNLVGVKFDGKGENVQFDIGARAFENCGTNALGGFTVNFNGQSIRTIGNNAFAGTSLTTLAINDSFDVEAFRKGGTAFNNLTVTLENGYNGTKYAEVDGVIYNKAKTKLLLVNTAKTGAFEIPTTVTEIGDYAFAESKLTSVRFANASCLEKMGVGAFRNSKLNEIALAQTKLQEIPAYAFYGTSVASVELPETVKSVGDYAFASSAIASFRAAGLKILGNSVFENCKNVKTVTTEDAAQTGVVLAASLKEMGNFTFAECELLTSASLPALEKLGGYTFYQAKNLKQASFDSGATATGTYTFYNTAIENFTFAAGQTVVEEGVFYRNRALKSVTLSTQIVTVGDGAFADCNGLKTVVNLENAVNIGISAFRNTAIESLALDNAEIIADGAFENVKATALSLPKVEKIGAYAFKGNRASSLDLPACVSFIGNGAFAAAQELKGIKVHADNTSFVAMDEDTDGYGVLYRYIDKDAGSFEIVCYPANRTQAPTDGKKTYEVQEGTLYVLSSAFLGLNKATDENASVGLDAVVLPYSVNAIGDEAFFDSGIKEYIFESIQAPVLEAVYRQDVREQIELIAESRMDSAYYKGYYYSNFESYFVNYTAFGEQKSNLIMRYPVNGVGYDNYIYTLYFGERYTTSVGMTDAARAVVSAIDRLAKTDLSVWLSDSFPVNEENLALVLAYDQSITAARTEYTIVANDQAQLAFIQSKEAQLSQMEESFRLVKEKFELQAEFDRLRVDTKNSTHKSTYKVDEYFDLTGLKVLIEYADGTQVEADSSKLKLAEDYKRKLLATDRSVVVEYDDGVIKSTLRVYINMESGNNQSEPPASSEEETGCNGSVESASVLTAMLAVMGVAVLLRKKKEN